MQRRTLLAQGMAVAQAGVSSTAAEASSISPLCAVVHLELQIGAGCGEVSKLKQNNMQYC